MSDFRSLNGDVGSTWTMGVIPVEGTTLTASTLAVVHFAAPHVVTLPDGSKVSIPAGSTAVEVFAKEAADDAAAMSWANGDRENDERRVEAMRAMEHRKTRRLIERLRTALASGSTALVAGGYAEAGAWLAANDGDPMCGALPTPTGWDPVGGLAVRGATARVTAGDGGTSDPTSPLYLPPDQRGKPWDAASAEYYGTIRGILSTVEGATHGEPQGLTAEAVWPSSGVRLPVEDDGA